MCPITLNEQNFKTEVLDSPLPVIVDFWAEWCGPCKMLLPTIEELSKELEGKVKVAKLNIDENQKLASQYSVMSIPTLLIFINGKTVERIVGMQPKKIILKKLGELGI